MYKFATQQVAASTTVTLNPPAGKTWLMGIPWGANTSATYRFAEVPFQGEDAYTAQLKGLALDSAAAVQLQNSETWAQWMTAYYYELDNPANDLRTLALLTGAALEYEHRPAAGEEWLLVSVKLLDSNNIPQCWLREGTIWYDLASLSFTSIAGHRSMRVHLTNARYLLIRGPAVSNAWIILTRIINPGVTPLWIAGSLASLATVRLTPAAGKTWLIGAHAGWSGSETGFWVYRVSDLQRLHNARVVSKQWWYIHSWLPDTAGLEMYNSSSTTAYPYAVNGIIEDNV